MSKHIEKIVKYVLRFWNNQEQCTHAFCCVCRFYHMDAANTIQYVFMCVWCAYVPEYQFVMHSTCTRAKKKKEKKMAYEQDEQPSEGITHL